MIGIDFGTSNCIVAVSRQGSAKVLENEQGKRKIPSCVAFTTGERLIGDAALHQMKRDPENTITDVKALVGLSFDSALHLVDQKKLPYKVVEDHGKAKIQVQEGSFYPEEIIAMILSRLKKCAENHLGEIVTGAVITVPNSFNAAQRRAIVDAAAIANLHATRLINETVAAAIVFGAKEQPPSKINLLVLHVGGGTFDATVLEIESNAYRVKGTSGSSSVGGDSYHDKLFKLTIAKNKSCRNITKKGICRLRLACEKAKKDLSLSDSTSIKVESISNDEDLEYSISVSVFEKYNEEFSKLIENSLKKAIRNANIDASKIDKVIFVGGASRMPIMIKILTERCGVDQRKLRKTVNVDEAPALGAAMLAELISSEGNEINDITIQDIAGYSITYRRHDEERTILTKGRVVPIIRFRELSNVGKRKFSFEVYATRKTDEKLGEFNATFDTNLIDAVTVGFEITVDGLLQVTVHNATGEVKLEQKTGIDLRKIQQLNNKVSDYEKNEETRGLVVKKLHQLEQDVYKVMELIDQKESSDSNFYKNCNRILDWINDNPCTTTSSESVQQRKDEIESMRHQLELRKMNFAQCTSGESVQKKDEVESMRDQFELRKMNFTQEQVSDQDCTEMKTTTNRTGPGGATVRGFVNQLANKYEIYCSTRKHNGDSAHGINHATRALKSSGNVRKNTDCWSIEKFSPIVDRNLKPSSSVTSSPIPRSGYSETQVRYGHTYNNASSSHWLSSAPDYIQHHSVGYGQAHSGNRTPLQTSGRSYPHTIQPSTVRYDQAHNSRGTEWWRFGPSQTG